MRQGSLRRDVSGAGDVGECLDLAGDTIRGLAKGLQHFLGTGARLGEQLGGC